MCEGRGTADASLAPNTAVDVLKGFPPTASAASLCWQCKKTRGPVLLFGTPGRLLLRARALLQWPKIIPARLNHSVIGPGTTPSPTTAIAEAMSASSVVQ